MSTGLAGHLDGRPADEAPRLHVVPVPAAPGARTLEITGDDPWADAVRRILGFHLERILQRVPGVLDGEDPEDVHQMRLSTRRMRAAWRVFGEGYGGEARRAYVADLRAIGACLGTVRDLDVRLEILDGYRQRRSRRQRRGLEPLAAAWREERHARHAELVDMLRAPRFEAFVDEYRAITSSVSIDVVPLTEHAPASVRQRIASRIWEAYEGVWAFEGQLDGADIVTLHQLRIAAKRLRYTLEFARLPLEPEGGALIRRVVALQDQLGDVHDLDLAAQHAREFVEGRPEIDRDVRHVTGAFVTAVEARVARLRGSLGPRWREVSSAEFRSRLGRGLGRL